MQNDKSKFKKKKLKLNYDYTIIDGKEYMIVPVPEKDLPVKLPYLEKYEPTGTGASPLAKCEDWVNTRCPKCGGPARRETDTMPNWAGSNWYYLAYTLGNKKLKIKNKKLGLGNKDFKKLFNYWMPVDLYNGGMEHTTLHLLYSRFWHKFLFDIGAVPCDEPYKARRSHGMVLAEDGRKMSKSFGNVINPDPFVTKYGADTIRVYEMFMGPYGEAIAWSTKTIEGVNRFLTKVKNLILKIKNKKQKTQIKNKKIDKLERLRHRTIKKVSEDIEKMKFNTAVSALMIFVNELEKQKQISIIDYETLLKLLAPFAPHLCEDIWQSLLRNTKLYESTKKSIFQEEWPRFDPRLVKEEEIELVIQINGRVRDKVSVSRDISKEEAQKLALDREKVKKYTKEKIIKKIIFVPEKLINIVL